MAETDTSTLKQRMRSQVRQFMADSSEPLRALREIFARRKWEAFLFGGVPRGAYNQPKSLPRDIDLVVADHHFEEVVRCFGYGDNRLNRFGGMKFWYRQLEVDIWSLSSTWAFRQGLVCPVSFEMLPSTTFFDADAIAIDFSVDGTTPRRVYENGFFHAWHNRLLGIGLEANPFPLLCVIRAARLALHYEFRFTPALTVFVHNILTCTPLADISALEESHYGNQWISPRTWLDLQLKIEKHLESNSLVPFAPFQQWFHQLDDASLHIFLPADPNQEEAPSHELDSEPDLWSLVGGGANPTRQLERKAVRTKKAESEVA